MSESIDEHRKIGNMQRLSITKRLNFLIGSGASIPPIPSMGDESYKDENGKFNNDKLTNKIKQVSDKIIEFKSKDKIKSEKHTKSDIEIVNKIDEYQNLINNIVNLLKISNPRESPKSVNIFSTNYDLFIEQAVDNILKNQMKLVFNDGANGYFKRYLDSHNFDKASSYRGQFERYNDEIPSISLIKPHGSINWTKEDNRILIENKVSDNPFIVKPDGYEAKNTFEQDHFFAMLRLFQQELDKEESILIVFGFSFGDEHIKDMVTRALQNPTLLVYVFAYNDNAAEDIKRKLNPVRNRAQLFVISPSSIPAYPDGKGNHDKEEGKKEYNKTFDLNDLAKILENEPGVGFKWNMEEKN